MPYRPAAWMTWGGPKGAPPLGLTRATTTVAERKVTTVLPPLATAIRGASDTSFEPGSTCWGGLQAPFTRRDTKGWSSPSTVFR